MFLVLRVFPTLAVPFALYLLFLIGGGAGLNSGQVALFHIPTASGGSVAINSADVIGLVVILCLSIDLGVAANTGAGSVVRLGIDTVLGIVCLVLFLLAPGFATTGFLMLTVATILEFMVGAGITVTAARRDVSFDSQGR
ncbi:MAG: hypothetical protein ABUL55_01955 [Pseudomonadota bacterium]